MAHLLLLDALRFVVLSVYGIRRSHPTTLLRCVLHSVLIGGMLLTPCSAQIIPFYITFCCGSR